MMQFYDLSGLKNLYKQKSEKHRTQQHCFRVYLCSLHLASVCSSLMADLMAKHRFSNFATGYQLDLGLDFD